MLSLSCPILMSTQQEWLPTPQAAVRLAVSSDTLKRRRDINGGYLVSGQNWRTKTESPNSTLLWEVVSIAAEFHKRRMNARRAEQSNTQEVAANG